MVRHSRSKQMLVALAVATLGFTIASCGAESRNALVGPAPVASETAFGLPPGTKARTSGASEEQLLAQIRQSTAKYQNIDAAFADGYVDDGYGCIDSADFGLDPSLGAMGFHLINWRLHDDPATDPLRPDILVYEVAQTPGSKPKLVAIEYEVFASDWYGAGNTQPPSLLGHPFELLEFDGLQFFGLHVWLWLNNPSGMFSDWNPNTSCPS